LNVPFSAKTRASSDVLIRELGDESVLLNLSREQYFGLDKMGTQIWKALVVSDSIQVAYEKLCDEYDVDAQVLHQDLQTLIEQLLEHGLLELD